MCPTLTLPRPVEDLSSMSLLPLLTPIFPEIQTSQAHPLQPKPHSLVFSTASGRRWLLPIPPSSLKQKADLSWAMRAETSFLPLLLSDRSPLSVQRDFSREHAAGFLPINLSAFPVQPPVARAARSSPSLPHFHLNGNPTSPM